MEPETQILLYPPAPSCPKIPKIFLPFPQATQSCSAPCSLFNPTLSPPFPVKTCVLHVFFIPSPSLAMFSYLCTACPSPFCLFQQHPHCLRASLTSWLILHQLNSSSAFRNLNVPLNHLQENRQSVFRLYFGKREIR